MAAKWRTVALRLQSGPFEAVVRWWSPGVSGSRDGFWEAETSDGGHRFVTTRHRTEAAARNAAEKRIAEWRG